jgi:thioredoxin reductase (NADPH)
MDTLYDVIIIGSGPAGLTAAIYTTRANLKTLVIAGVKWGGQLMLTTLVENFPGFASGIQGPDLMMNMRKQAEHFGAEFVDENFVSGDFRSGGPFTLTAGEKRYKGRAVIIATGADTKWLGVPGEQEKIGRGVASCAPCDAFFFRDKEVIVAGGGDSAMEEAMVLTRFARNVTVVHRRNELRASKIMQDKARANSKIKFLLNTQITEIMGDMKVEKVKLKDVKTGTEREMAIDGVFVAIGHIPNSSVFANIEKDEKGYVKVTDNRTNIEGVFSAGDVHDHFYAQAVVAAGYGCQAALLAEKWLDTR